MLLPSLASKELHLLRVEAMDWVHVPVETVDWVAAVFDAFADTLLQASEDVVGIKGCPSSPISPFTVFSLVWRCSPFTIVGGCFDPLQIVSSIDGGILIEAAFLRSSDSALV